MRDSARTTESTEQAFGAGCKAESAEWVTFPSEIHVHCITTSISFYITYLQMGNLIFSWVGSQAGNTISSVLVRR